MGNSPLFDYEQPTRDTLAGIYVEVSDEPSEQAGGVDHGSSGQAGLQLAALFGLTLTVDDSPIAKQADVSAPH